MRKIAFVVAMTACAVILVSLAPAQDASTRVTPDISKRISPSAYFQLSPAVERTPEQMNAFDAAAAFPAETKEAPGPRPTIDAALHAQLKQRASLAPRMMKPGATNAPGPSQLATVNLKFVGATECDGPGGCWVPPDVAGSVGKTQFVSVSNDVFEVRSRAGVLLQINSLNGLFQYSTESLFDPRVQYDEEYQRWVIIADAFAESSTVQWLYVGVSQTSSATGKWWIYRTNTNGFTGTGSFFDYPMLGISQDAVLITGNVFGSSSFLGAYAFALAKAHIYNGFGWSVPVFKGLAATLAPSHQLLTDQNGYAWFAAAPGNSSAIDMYAMSFPSNPNDSVMYGPYVVSGVSAFNYPPGAAQPSSCAPAGALLDTLDNRFQNVGIQNGDLLYQAHTTGDFGVATTRYYIISGLLSFAPTVSTQNDFWASTSSYDFNPSITSDNQGHFALNWSSTDPANNVLASMRFADNKAGNPSGQSGINVFTSASCYTGVGTSRWGDYSQISLDPGTGATASVSTKVFWMDNETIPSANFWSTEIAKVTY